jgi:2-dehydropantoate 2-reductase
MQITVMGPGGVGGYFGARLAAAGHDVTFVARGAHLEAMRRDGLRLESTFGNLTLQPTKAVGDAREVAKADVVLFAVKLGDTETAAEGLRGLVAGGASVFTFQNGVESFDRLAAVLGAKSVVPGVARIASHIRAPGIIEHTGKFASLEMGEKGGGTSPRVTAFLEACKGAGIKAEASPDIDRSLWLKFVMLAPMSGLTSLTRGPIGPIRATPETRALLEQAVGETVAVGRALGVAIEPADGATVLRLIDGLHADMTSSMCHDLKAGKPLELMSLSGALVRLGEARGVPTPAHTFIVQALAPFAKGARA